MNISITLAGDRKSKAVRISLILWLACNLAMLGVAAGIVWLMVMAPCHAN